MPVDPAADAGSDFEEWDKNETGHLKLWPFLGFSTALFANERGGLRLEVGAPPKPGKPAAAVQVAFSEGELRQLAAALTDVADRLVAAQKATHHA
jgi:hypothetical protein